MRKQTYQIRSNQTVTQNGVVQPKLPSASDINIGELALNYKDGYETISIKNDNNEIVTFATLEQLINYMEGYYGNAKIFKGTCATAAATTAKVVTCPLFKSTDLVKGTLIFVTFDYTNSGAVGSLTMNVNSTGAKSIKKLINNTAIASSNLSHAGELKANQTYLFEYDGTYWVCTTLDYNSTSEQVQTDWNQTTTTAKDYIKNKPYIKSGAGGEPDTISTKIGQLTTDDLFHYIEINGNKVEVSTTRFMYNNKEVAVKDDIPSEITTGHIVGRMHRDNVSGTGNLTITGASGEGFTPNGITTAGKYVVVVYSWSDTKTFGYNISFGSNNYTLSTTDGTISDKRELTVSAGALWSGTVTTAVSAGTTIIVEIYKAEKTTQALSVGTVALTNLYNDLDGKPTISSSTSSSSTTDIASSKAVKLAYDHGGVQSVNGQTGAVTLTLGDANVIESISVNGVAQTITNKNVDITLEIPEGELSENYATSELENEDLMLAPGDTYEEAFSKVEKAILDNEETVAGALNDLNERLLNADSAILSKQDILTSGTNIKTINNESLLGSGNITIQSGSGGDTNVIESVKVNGTALTPDANKAVDITSIPASIVTQDSTHRFVSDTEKTTWNNKISNVQADWNATSGLAQILNKPTIPDDSNLVHKTGDETINGTKMFTNESGPKVYINSNIVGNFGIEPEANKWEWIKYKDKGSEETLQQALDARNNLVTSVNGMTGAVTLNIPDAQIQADWNQTTTTAKDYIKNKPHISSDGNWVSQIMFGPETTLSGNDSDGLTLYADDDIQLTTAGKAYYNNKEIAVKDDIKVTSVNGMTGAVTITETQLSKGTATGTGNAVTDINVSNHQITLVKGATYTTQEDVNQSIAALVDSAPETLNTLNELAAALGDDPNFATTVATQIGNKADKSNMTAGTYKSVTVNNQGIVTAGTNPTTLAGYGITDAKIQNGVITLGSNTITPLTSFTETDPTVQSWAKNTIDFLNPGDGNEPSSGTKLIFDSNTFKNSTGRTNIFVSLKTDGNSIINGVLDETSDTYPWNNSSLHVLATNRFLRPIIDAKAPSQSPTFTGTPKAPTAATGTNTTQIATTAFVQQELQANGGEENVIETVKVNNVALTPDANKAVNIDLTDYDKVPLVIEINDTDTTVPSGTYASIGTALAAGRKVIVKYTIVSGDGDSFYLPLVWDASTPDQEYDFGGAYFNIIYSILIASDDTFVGNMSILLPESEQSNHVHGNIKSGGTLQKNDITITSGDKLVITDSSDSNKIARASLTFDGSTTTTALTPKGTWESFGTYSKPSGGIPTSDLTSAIQTSLGKADSAIQGVKVNGTSVTPDSNKIVDITIPEGELSTNYEPSSLENEDLELAAGDTYEEAFSKLEKTVNDNENITAAALVDLDGRIPTKTSDLTNDSGFITQAPVTSVNGQTGAVVISDATTSNAGLMSSTDKSKLDGLPSNVGDVRVFDVVGTTNDGVTTFDYGTTKFSDIANAYKDADAVFLRCYNTTDKSQSPICILRADECITGDSGELTIMFHSLLTFLDTAVTIFTLQVGDNDSINTSQTAVNISDKQDTITDLDTIRSNAGYGAQAWNELGNYQELLVSGTNIKTINNQSLLGEGNITIQGGSGGDTNVIETVKVNGTALTPDSNKAVDVTVPIAIYFGTYTQNTNATGVNDMFIFNLTTPQATIKADVDNGKEVILIFDKSDNNDGTNNRWEFYYTNTEAANLLYFESSIFGYPCHLTYDSSGISLTVAQFALSSDLSSVATSGDYNDLTNTPTIPAAVTESTVSGWGFTKNAGTITGITMNGSSKGTSGVVDLGTVATANNYVTGGSVNSSTGSISLTRQGLSAASVTGLSTYVNNMISAAKTGSGGYDDTYVAKAGDTMTGALTVNAAAANTVNIIGGDNSSGNQIALNVGSRTHANMFQVFDDGSAHIVANGTLEVTPSSGQTGLQITSTATTDTALTTNGKVIANQFVKSGGTSGQLLRADGSVMTFPAFSSADNGKVLSVVSGSLAWVTPTAIYSGTSTPDSNTGNNGDLYLQTS